MTIRARPGSNRPRSWDDRERRTLLLNIGFGLTVVAALLLLLIAVGVAWYGDHLAGAATVNGQTISKDAYRKQLAINAFLVDYQGRRLRTLLTAGRIRTADYQARNSVLEQRKQQASTLALEQLIDGAVMEQLAAKQGIAVTDADVDASIADRATTPELRHAWMIAVKPEVATGETTPTDAEKAAAKAKAQQALTDLKAGKDWATGAKAVSTDASKDQGGDLGYLDKDASLDPAFLGALVAAARDVPTEVIEGADGIYRVGRVTEIIAPVVDATLQEQAKADGIDLGDFRAAFRRETVRTKLSDAILAPYLVAGPQRQVAEIWMRESQSESGPGAIRVRHILYSPKGDPQGAKNVPEADPSWADAERKARATYAKLKTDPSQFDAIARAESDEGAQSTGGKLPYFSTDDPVDAAFMAAITKPGLEPGQLLEPVKSAFGWHVIQVMHGPTDMEWAAKLKVAAEGGTDFGVLARDNSDRDDAASGGGLGWVAKGQLGPEVEAAIFATKVGTISDPLKVDGDGVYLFKVSKEETRPLDAQQRQIIESTAFSRWYSPQKAAFTITRDPAIATPG